MAFDVPVQVQEFDKEEFERSQASNIEEFEAQLAILESKRLADLAENAISTCQEDRDNLIEIL
jgi:hypothetical protein